MHLQSNARQRSDEYRRYFPDWTDGSPQVQVGEELEADHNSYLAGGYAEEFGYLAPGESYGGAPLFDEKSPGDDVSRLVQRAVMHPGPPVRPYPISVDRDELRDRALSPSPSGVSHLGKFEVRDRGRFVRVTERPYEREHRQLAHRLGAALMRFIAAVVALRWKLPSLRKGRQPRA